MSEPQLTTAGALAERLGATLRGAPDVGISCIESLDRAGPDTLSFIRDDRNLEAWRASRCAAAFISATVAANVSADEPALKSRALIVVDDPDLAMIKILELLAPRPHHPRGVSPGATVDPSATVAPDVSIATGVVIGPRAVIGNRSQVGTGASVTDSVLISDCEIGANAVVTDSILSPGGKVAEGARVDGRVLGKNEVVDA